MTLAGFSILRQPERVGGAGGDACGVVSNESCVSAVGRDYVPHAFAIVPAKANWVVADVVYSVYVRSDTIFDTAAAV